MRRVRQVRKRDGRLAPFERSKIADAIFRAARAMGGEDRFLAEELAGVVVMHLEQRGTPTPSIEDIQDVVERVLIETGHARTAKAYILYRERRTEARQARTAVEGAPELLLGGEGGRDAVSWSKADLVDRLVATGRLDRAEAEDIARAVEERLLASGRPRVAPGLVAALVRAELHDRGRDRARGADERLGVRRRDVRAWLEAGVESRRAADPRTFTTMLGEEVLCQYVLGEVLPSPVAESHRLGDLHCYDLGAPVSLTSVALPLRRLLASTLRGDGASRAGGPRRIASALGEILDGYAPYAARCLALEDLNVHLAPFVSHLDEDALGQEMRELLLSPAFGAFPGRGGLRELEVGLAVEVPARLASEPVPAPAPPGCHYGHFGDAAREVGRSLLREATALRRKGWDRGPRFTLMVSRDGPPDAATRALVREALASAAEVGDPLVAFEEPGTPTRGSRWLRIGDAEAADPLRFPTGDVSAATACGINLVAAALRVGRGGTDAFLAELDRLVRLALDAATARRALLESAGEEPGRTLYPLHRGPVPLVDLDGAWHLLEPVGVERAVHLLEPSADADYQTVLRRRILTHVQERAALEATPRGLHAAVAEGLAPEAGARFARLDALRYGEAAIWWAEGVRPSYATQPPPPGETRHEPAWLDRRSLARSFTRVRHRVHAESRPPIQDLLAALEAAAHDASVVEYALEPWPTRLLHRESSQ